MQLNAKSLKRPSWQSMRRAVPSAILVTLVYFLLTDILANVVSLFTPTVTVDELIYGRGAAVWVGLFLAVLLTIYQVVMSFGYSTWALHTARDQQVGMGSLLNGFGMVGRVLLMELQIALLSLGWVLMLSFVYAFVVVIIVLLSELSVGFAIVLIIVSSLALCVVLTVILLRYELAPYLLYDYPDAGPGTAVRRSVEMMRGHVWELFKVLLSFWPWFVAGLVIELAVSAAVLAPLAQELSALLYSGSVDQFTTQIQLALDAPLASLLLMVLRLPLDLFYTPYRRITSANFYRTLSQEPVNPSFSGETF